MQERAEAVKSVARSLASRVVSNSVQAKGVVMRVIGNAIHAIVNGPSIEASQLVRRAIEKVTLPGEVVGRAVAKAAARVMAAELSKTAVEKATTRATAADLSQRAIGRAETVIAAKQITKRMIDRAVGGDMLGVRLFETHGGEVRIKFTLFGEDVDDVMPKAVNEYVRVGFEYPGDKPGLDLKVGSAINGMQVNVDPAKQVDVGLKLHVL